MLAVEAGAAREGDALAVHEEADRAQALADLGVGAQGEGRAVHVELGVAAGVAAVADGEVQKLVAMGLERVGHRPQELAPLREGQRPQRGTTRAAREVERGGEIEPRAAGLRQRLFGRGVDERLGVAALDPATRQMAAKRDRAAGYCHIPSRVNTNA